MSEFIKTIHTDSSIEVLENLIEFQENKDVRVVILSFSNESDCENNDDLITKIEGFPKPVITLINEKAKGFLFEIVLASNICIATENTSFEISNKEKTKQQIGSKNIEKLEFLEKEFDAQTALDLGILNKIVSLENIEEEAVEMAERISKLAPLAIEYCLQAVNKGLKMELKEGLELETKLFSKVFSTEDMREGTRAFLEKRKPKFKGK